MVHLKEIFEDYIVAKLDNSLKVTDVTARDAVTGIQLIKLCDPKWLKLYGGFFNSDGTYLFSSTQPNSLGYYSVNVPNVNDTISKHDTLKLKRPVVFQGTLFNTTEEWHKFSDDERDKLPFIWIVSPTTERFEGKMSMIDRTAEVRCFFVHWSDWLNDKNEDRMINSVVPLFELVEEFVNTIEREKEHFRALEDWRTKDFAKFGTESANGTTSVIGMSTLSAIEFNASIEILKFGACC